MMPSRYSFNLRRQSFSRMQLARMDSSRARERHSVVALACFAHSLSSASRACAVAPGLYQT